MAVKIKTFDYFFFSIGGYFDGYTSIEIDKDDLEIKHSKKEYLQVPPFPNDILDKDLKENLIATLNQISFSNWEKEYVDHGILDGTNWNLEIKYNGRKTSKISSGSNAFPLVKFEKDEIVKLSTSETNKDFKKLLKILNKIAKKKNFFY